MIGVLLAIGCAGGEDAETGDSPACRVPEPATERIDVTTGYRTFDAPVDAAWVPGRTVPVNLWYPTDAASGEAATYLDTWPDPSSLVDAPLDPAWDGCRHPLVVYSHGSQAWAGNGSSILRHLAAQGWVAAGPDHVGNTLVDNVEPRPVSYSRTRVADVIATIDAIEALPEGDPLHGRVDTSRVVVVGHSFGGQTAWLLAGPSFDTAAIAARCEESELGCTAEELAAYDAPAADPRVAAVVPMDGTAGTDLVAQAGWEEAEIPIVYLSQAGSDEAFLRAGAADVTWAAFEGACHETFTDTALPCDTFDKAEGLDATAAYLSATAATYGMGSGAEEYAAILDGRTVVDERIAVRRTRD
jgi:predicted dienelactone hydrolase